MNLDLFARELSKFIHDYLRKFAIIHDNSRMIIRNCHKKYNLCRNDAAASPFGKGCHEVAGYVSNNHTLLTPKCFSIGNYFIETYPQPLYSVTHSATVSRASSWTLRFHAFRKGRLTHHISSIY